MAESNNVAADPNPATTSAVTFAGQQVNQPEPSSGEVITLTDGDIFLGESGTRIFQGFITGEEYSPDLAGREGLLVYDQMRRSDPACSVSYDILKAPILSADWDIEPASDDDNDLLVGEFVKHNIFERICWQDFLEEGMLHLPMGFSVFVKKFVRGKWAGNVKGQGAGQYILLDGLESRKQSTIFAWQKRDGGAGLTQIGPSGGMHDIDAKHLLIFTNQREGKNYEGISIYRPAYKPYYLKSQLEKVAAIAAARQGTGIPYAKAPTNAGEAEKKLVRAALKNMRANEQSYIEVPQGWEVGFIDLKGQTLVDPSPQINRYDWQILLNVLGQYLMIGASGSSGTRSTSEDHSQFQTQKLELIADSVANTINNNLIKQLVDANFNVKKYPKLVHDRIGDDKLLDTADGLQKLVTAKIITPDAELEEHIRKQWKLPALPDEYKKDYANRPGAQPAAPIMPAGMPGTMPGNPGTAGKTAGNPDDTKQQNIDTKTDQPKKASDGLDLRGFYDALGDQIEALADAPAAP